MSLAYVETRSRQSRAAGNAQQFNDPNDPNDPRAATPEKVVTLRPIPYPYQAALTICSDIDDTKSTDDFLEIQRFLNTKQHTSLGQGVGLEIGNSFYFYDDDRYFSYFTHDERAQRVTRDLIQAGFIDCLHTYGDAATTRDECRRALDTLDQAGCHLDVWINHFGSRSNVGKKFAYMFRHCQGDDPTSDTYHTDMTLAYGIRFAWVGAMTRIVGQGPACPNTGLSTVFDPAYPLGSALDVGKEIRKSLLAGWGDERYRIQRDNQLMQPLELADGRQLHEFRRYCCHPNDIPYGGTARGLPYLLSQRHLDQLKARQGVMIAYTHFGQNLDAAQLIAPETQAALRRLEQEYRADNIYVTTTSKLLNYQHAYNHLIWSSQDTPDGIQIHIDHIDDPIFGKTIPTAHELRGLTFEVADNRNVNVFIQDRRIDTMQRNPVGPNGRTNSPASVMFPLHRLDFPY